MVKIDHKRGDTFFLTCSVPLAFGQSLSSVAAQARRNDVLVEAFTYTAITPTDTEFRYTLSATATQTAAWAPGQLLCDIQYTVGDLVASTETFAINVIRDETRPI